MVTGTGGDVEAARLAAYANAKEFYAPNVRYRLDIGHKLIAGDLARLESWGWVKSTPLSRTASQIVR